MVQFARNCASPWGPNVKQIKPALPSWRLTSSGRGKKWGMEKRFNRVRAKCVKFYKGHKLVTWGKDHFQLKGRGVSPGTLTRKARISVDPFGALRRTGNKTKASLLWGLLQKPHEKSPCIGGQCTKGRDLCLCKSRKTGGTHKGKYRKAQGPLEKVKQRPLCSPTSKRTFLTILRTIWTWYM